MIEAEVEASDSVLLISHRGGVTSGDPSPVSSPKTQSLAGDDGHSSADVSPHSSISLGPQTPRDSVCTTSDACPYPYPRYIGGVAMRRESGRKITISPDLDGSWTPTSNDAYTSSFSSPRMPWDRVCLERDWRDGGIQQIRRACSSELAPTIRFYPDPPFLPEQRPGGTPKKKTSWRSLSSAASQSNPAKLFSIVLTELLELHDARRIARDESIRLKMEQKSQMRHLMASYNWVGLFCSARGCGSFVCSEGRDHLRTLFVSFYTSCLYFGQIIRSSIQYLFCFITSYSHSVGHRHDGLGRIQLERDFLQSPGTYVLYGSAIASDVCSKVN